MRYKLKWQSVLGSSEISPNTSLAGFLLVDKPASWTSFDVVNKIRFTLAKDAGVKPKHLKVGHSGTLDPMATGLLLIAVGKATKQLPGLIKKDKVYAVDAIFGATSDTGDGEGEITKRDGPKPPSKSAVEAVLSRFEGKISQKPPAYSAIKVDGQRAYKLARAGKVVELEPRTVTVNSISDVRYDWPKLSFVTDVSSGTYIRSLVDDIGEELDVGAYMSGLRRTQIDHFSVDQAITISKEIDAKTLQAALIPVEELLQ